MSSTNAVIKKQVNLIEFILRDLFYIFLFQRILEKKTIKFFSVICHKEYLKKEANIKYINFKDWEKAILSKSMF